MKENIAFSLPDPLVWYDSRRFNRSSRGSWHSHPDWQMSIVLEGEIAFKLKNGNRHDFKPGQIALLPPGVPHLSLHESEKGRYAQLFFRKFSPDTFPEPAQKFNFPANDIFSATADLGIFTELVNTINRRCKLTAPLCMSWRIILSNTFLLQGVELFCEQCESNRTKVPKAIPKALDYLEQHYNNDLSVEDIANHVGLSVSRFSAIFHDTIGSSPLQHLNQLRLSKAQTMLLNNCSVKEAALQNGFSSVEYFCRFFKKKTGQTPGEFKKSPFNS